MQQNCDRVMELSKLDHCLVLRRFFFGISISQDIFYPVYQRVKLIQVILSEILQWFDMNKSGTKLGFI